MSADGFSSGPPPGAAADWTIDQGWDAYTAAEHDVWDLLYERQSALLPDDSGEPVGHPHASLIFEGFEDGHYNMRPRIAH